MRDLWFDRIEQAQAGIVRTNVTWHAIAGDEPPADRPIRQIRRPEVDDAGPSRPRCGRTWPLDVMFLFNTAPRWAEGDDRPSGTQPGSWKPDPIALGKFAQAVATRYSGSYPDPLGGTLPQVRYYEAWNEPNLDFWLAPQFSGGKNTGPELYRDLHNALAEGVKSVDADNQVIGPALAPFGGITGEKKTRTRPLKFMRDLFCLKGRKLKPTKCPGGERLIIDIVSHHPLTTTGPPNQHAVNPDDATAGDMDKIRKTTRAAEKAGKLLPAGVRRPIWVSEFWYRSDPPSDEGVPLPKQARWVEQSLYIFWKQGVKAAIYNLLRDKPNFNEEAAFGLYFRDGDAKPAAKAYRFPFVADRKSKRKLTIWGKSPATGKVVVERQKGKKHKKWKRVKRFDAQAGRVFTGTVKLKGKQKLRASIKGERSLTWTQRR
ncbi:MAG: hypothetical protein U0R26_10585 [Solirubrobacterales bacterium]